MIKFLLSILLLTASAGNCQSKNYFISPTGDDNNSGLSIKSAWKTLDKVNEVTFPPGDQILFETGGTWYGK